MRQGYIGNCWFLAGAAAVAEVPDRLEKIFLNPSNRLSPNGIYGINIWTLGVKHTIIVDDWLPVQTWGNGYNTLFAHVGPDQALWMSILEKAFSKYHGNYEHIVAGNPMNALRTLHGAPWSSVWHENVDWTDKESLEAVPLWDRINEHDNIDDMITAATPSAWYKGEETDGLVKNHAYVVLGTAYIATGDIRLVKLRNPQSLDKFRGDWSDSSATWTPELEAVVKA